MNYYERHLGDFAKDTAHLTALEVGIYDLLLDRYYATEAPIPEDQAHRIARARTRDEKAAAISVLGEFFRLENGSWINPRSEEEISKAQTKIKAAQENGRRGGRPKGNPTQTQHKPIGLSVGSNLKTQDKAHQTPDSTVIPSEDKSSGDKSPKPPVDQSKTELWRSAVSLLEGQGMAEPQARSLIGKLAKDYKTSGEDIVLEAVRGAVSEQPADARAYLKATCQRLAGERKRDGSRDWTEAAI